MTKKEFKLLNEVDEMLGEKQKNVRDLKGFLSICKEKNKKGRVSVNIDGRCVATFSIPEFAEFVNLEIEREKASIAEIYNAVEAMSIPNALSAFFKEN